jgi:hypothetical protein
MSSPTWRKKLPPGRAACRIRAKRLSTVKWIHLWLGTGRLCVTLLCNKCLPLPFACGTFLPNKQTNDILGTKFIFVSACASDDFLVTVYAPVPNLGYVRITLRDGPVLGGKQDFKQIRKPSRETKSAVFGLIECEKETHAWSHQLPLAIKVPRRTHSFFSVIFLNLGHSGIHQRTCVDGIL